MRRDGNSIIIRRTGSTPFLLLLVLSVFLAEPTRGLDASGKKPFNPADGTCGNTGPWIEVSHPWALV